ncbi:MAG: aspartoacylase [Bacteriovoracaceae bacterium]|jgi:aspartoacylase|nr:aspartoacylase [Bacteriovoracaceae bacterium]
MKFAIIGGTHGNEPVGIKTIEKILAENKETLNSYKTFLGNPKAYDLKKRYVDSDLNRAFGPNGSSKGYEKKRSSELTDLIKDKFDFILDLHTTTSNMKFTVILTRIDEFSLKAACFLQKQIPSLKIIVSLRAGNDCPYTSSLANSALTVEFGPVINNVEDDKLIKTMFELTTKLLDYDFGEEFNYEDIECYQVFGIQSYPDQGQWEIHKDIDGHDFDPITYGNPMFCNDSDEIITYKGPNTIYPLFVNEAAYQENNTAMEMSLKTTLANALFKLK